MVDTRSLPSWNDGAAKSAILDFVARITKQGAADFVPPAERISTFDIDGTLWCEQPLQVQLFFLFDRVKELSAKDPAMVERLPFKAVLEHDYNTLFGLGKQALFELVFATHTGIRTKILTGLRADGSQQRNIPSSAGYSRNASTGRRSNCSHICGRTASRPT
jgi:hypothetical protein